MKAAFRTTCAVGKPVDSAEPQKTPPFTDVIASAPTRAEERKIAPHPSLKPQAFMRQIVRASLPLGSGVVLDPFLGGGSTIAAASAVGYESIGIELDPLFFAAAKAGIPALARFPVNGTTRVMKTNGIMHLNGKGQANGV